MPPRDADRAGVRRLAMDMLARREHSGRELERKLLARGHAADLVGEVLSELEKDGLLDERRFAEAFVRSRTSRGKGPLLILAELGERGIEARLARAVLDETGTDWGRLARRVLERRFGLAPAPAMKERARRVRFLSRRGFTAEQIRTALADTETD